LESKYNFLIAI